MRVEPQSDQVVALIIAAGILLEQIKTALCTWCMLTDLYQEVGPTSPHSHGVENHTHLGSFTRVS